MVRIASILRAGSELELVIELVFSSLKIKDRQVGLMSIVSSSDFFCEFVALDSSYGRSNVLSCSIWRKPPERKPLSCRFFILGFPQNKTAASWIAPTLLGIIMIKSKTTTKLHHKKAIHLLAVQPDFNPASIAG